jgi:hypothetical protein
VDGDTHADTLAYDRARDKILQRLGFSILRFTNDEVIKNVDGVVMMIIERASEIANNYKCESLLISPLPNPPHEGEGSLSRTSRVG